MTVTLTSVTLTSVTLTTLINKATCTVVDDKELIAFDSPAARHNGINKLVDWKAMPLLCGGQAAQHDTMFLEQPKQRVTDGLLI